MLVDPGGGAPIESQPRAAYSYYGGNQRATKHADTDQDVNFGPDKLERFYYDPSWRMLEQRIDTNRPETTWDDDSVDYDAHSRIVQKVWGQRYIDELIAVLYIDAYNPADSASGTGPSFDSMRYAMTDRNFSVIGLGFEYDPDGGLSPDLLGDAVRIRYSPYGEHEARLVGDADFDGTISRGEALKLPATPPGGYSASDSGYSAEWDLDGDGYIGPDTGVVQNSLNVSVSELGERLGNSAGYAGYLYDRDAGMYHVRHRWYTPDTGRWASRDPAGYVDGTSLYAYGLSSPSKFVDPSGRTSVHPDPLDGEPVFVPEGQPSPAIPPVPIEDLTPLIPWIDPDTGDTLPPSDEYIPPHIRPQGWFETCANRCSRDFDNELANCNDLRIYFKDQCRRDLPPGSSPFEGYWLAVCALPGFEDFADCLNQAERFWLNCMLESGDRLRRCIENCKTLPTI
jgi:RHS repeat-associated protein